jgi:hypothetical protein
MQKMEYSEAEIQKANHFHTKLQKSSRIGANWCFKGKCKKKKKTGTKSWRMDRTSLKEKLNFPYPFSKSAALRENSESIFRKVSSDSP